ncbi:hypothetical protein GF380_06510 [Candidatus Uhrbacteria bacterium]|nr:hypothetical protein [Candidatus Uhrbacteria bacterium]MBD3284586.1 hypothetical protein [Candidatus Uhrbacteria bacterium]
MQQRRISSWFPGFVIGVLATIALPLVAQAQTTPAMAQAAVVYANQQGFCNTTSDRKGDCVKRRTVCNNEKWASLVSQNTEIQGGMVVKKKDAAGISPIAAINPLAAAVDATTRSPIVEFPPMVYNYLRAESRNLKSLPVYNEGSCFCRCKEGETAAECLNKNTGAPVLADDKLYTRELCAARCKQLDRTMDTKCAGSLQRIIRTAPGQQVSAENLLQAQGLCFTGSECEEQDGIWEPWELCKQSKGRCYAKEPVITLNIPIGGVKEIQGVNTYIVTVYRYAVSILAVIVTVMFIAGAFLYMLSSAIESIQKGKDLMRDAIIGMLLVLGAATILRTLNPALLTLNPIKVYMINTIQFINAQSCSNLDKDLELADAGVPPDITDRSAIGDGSYTVEPKQAECGHKYWVKGATGDPCDGTACFNDGEICTSCASGSYDECQGVASTRKVCASVEIGGTINYHDGRVPEAVYLVYVCNFAQPTPEQINARTPAEQANFVHHIATAKVTNVSHVVGGKASDKNQSGQATYQFNLKESDADSKAEQLCEGKGGVRGAVLAVQYNDNKDATGKLITAATEGVGAVVGNADDFAIIAKSDCNRSGANLLTGYGTGQGANFNENLIARASLCAFSKNRMLSGGGTYWSVKPEILEAIQGRKAIRCEFNLADGNAPSNPSEDEAFCTGKAKLTKWRVDYDGSASTEHAGECGGGIPCANTNAICFFQTANSIRFKQPCICGLDGEWHCEDDADCSQGAVCNHRFNICRTATQGQWCTCLSGKWECDTIDRCIRHNSCEDANGRCLSDDLSTYCRCSYNLLTSPTQRWECSTTPN